jgi:hypothetical protein
MIVGALLFVPGCLLWVLGLVIGARCITTIVSFDSGVAIKTLSQVHVTDNRISLPDVIQVVNCLRLETGRGRGSICIFGRDHFPIIIYRW